MSDHHPLPSAVKPSSLARKRVFGVPVLYLVAGFVLILALYAFKTKAKPSATPAADAADAAAGATPTVADLFPAQTSGTVTTAPAGMGAGPVLDNAGITSNDDWLKKGVAYLGTKGVGGGTAQGALSAYLEGSALTTVQGQYRDQVIAQLGLPPYVGKYGGDVAAPDANDGSNSAAIAAAYTKFLRRSASQDEINFWLPIARQSGIAFTVATIQNSAEAQRVQDANGGAPVA